MSAVPPAPWVFFQLSCSCLAYSGFSKEWDTVRQLMLWAGSARQEASVVWCFNWAGLHLLQIPSPSAQTQSFNFFSHFRQWGIKLPGFSILDKAMYGVWDLWLLRESWHTYKGREGKIIIIITNFPQFCRRKEDNEWWKVCAKSDKLIQSKAGFEPADLVDFNSETSILIHLCECTLCMLSHFSHVRLCNPMDCSPPVSPVQFSVCACVLITQSCPTLCDPMDSASPGSSVNGILQVGILEWVSIPSSRGSSQPTGWAQVSCIPGRFLTIWATRGAHSVH